MPAQLLHTKLYTPPVHRPIVLRSPLIQKLNKGLDHRLTLLSAPAGFGKSTLLSAWAEQSPLPVAWLSLDSEDNIPSRFWSYFGAALHHIPWMKTAGVGEGLLGLLHTPHPPSIIDLLTTLVNEITTEQTRAVLILDDLHTITHPDIHAGLVFLLTHLPPPPHGLHLMIASRRDPPWPLARLRAQQACHELRIVDLRFSLIEAAAFLKNQLNLTLSPEDLAALDARIEGWVTGLQLAGISLSRLHQDRGQTGVSSFIRSFSGSNRFVLDYLVDEVLNQQPQSTVDFLLQTAVLDRFTAPLCSQVTARDDCQAIINQLEESNLFVIPLDDDRCWYRYHHLFQDLLKKELLLRRPEEIAPLHQRASLWFETQGYLDEAIAHAASGKDFGRAAGLIEQHGLVLITQGELITLDTWLALLPEEHTAQSTWLCLYKAWVHYYHGPREQVEPWLVLAEKHLENQPVPGQAPPIEDRNRALGHVSALRAYLALQAGQFTLVSKLAGQALSLLPAGDYARATSAIALAEHHRTSGDLSRWFAAYAAAKNIALESGNLPMAISATAYMADQLVKQGKLTLAAPLYQEAIRLGESQTGTPTPAAGLPYIKLGECYRQWNNLPAALESIALGLRLCQKWGHADTLVLGYTAQARVFLALDRIPEARTAASKAIQLTQTTQIDPWTVSQADGVQIALYLAEGALDAAVRWVEIRGWQVDDELTFLQDLAHIHLARVRLAQGNHLARKDKRAAAQQLLDRLYQKAASTGWVDKQIPILLLQALACDASHQPGKAAEKLDHALRLAKPGNYRRIFLDEGVPMASLLQKNLRTFTEHTYALDLLEGFTQSAPVISLQNHTIPRAAPPSHPASQPLVEPLSEREMQVLRLLNSSLSGPEIASELYIAISTVRTHIRQIYRKLDVTHRMEAVHRAKELNLL